MNKVISIWYSNLGAVQMSQAELKNFPTDQWETAEIIPQLENAESSLRLAVQYNPHNHTANYRLGMISMLRQDFRAASRYFETAYNQVPRNRFLVKNLGYSYVWLGEMYGAKVLLEQIPEVQEELNAYIWWWDVQNRSDLSANASILVSKLTDIQR